MPCRVEQNVDRILELLAESGECHATFFTLGWIAERYPQMVQRIVAGGHELASHGYAHERASALEPDAFFADVALAKAVLEDIAGTEVRGYRAPSFSIGADNLWAYDCLAKAGYRYSSSVYPIRHDHYGSPDRSRFAHVANTHMLEVPIATARLFRTNWPAGGGGYFRLMPYALSRWLIQRVNSIDEEAAIFYFHPWEIDPEQPRVRGVDREDALSSLRAPGAHREALCACCCRISAGIAWTTSSSVSHERARNRAERASGRGGRTCAFAASAREDRARWEEFVHRCPDATFFHRIGWKDIIEGCFGHQHALSCSPSAMRRLSECCRWPK